MPLESLKRRDLHRDSFGAIILLATSLLLRKLGHLGEPFARDQQLAIAEDVLAALESIEEPGTIVELPCRR